MTTPAPDLTGEQQRPSLTDPEFTPLPAPARRPGMPGQRFSRVVERDVDFEVDDNGCFVITSHRHDKRGYGILTLYRQRHLAHRAVWLDTVGQIPDGMHLDHLCRNRACINPDHMEVVTPRENTLRGMSSPAVNARRSGCIHGHEYTPETTRWYQGKRYCGACRPIKRRAVDAVHGSQTKYRLGCRCQLCFGAESARNRARYLKRKAA